MRVFRVFLGLAFLALPLPVFADPVTVVVAVRSVTADASVIPTVPFGTPAFNQDVLTKTMTTTNQNGTATSIASLTSDVDGGDGAFAGEGKTSVIHASTATASGGYTQIDYGVLFDVTEAQQFALAASFLVAGLALDSDSHWNISLRDAERNPVFEFRGSDSQNLTATGLLLPGQYLFGMFSVSQSFFAGTGGSSNTFNFNLALTAPAAAPTPEPASIVLLMTGAIGVLARQRMRSPR